MKAPTPVNKNPWLPSVGYDEMKATRHRYVKTVETSVSYNDSNSIQWEDVWQYIFVCEETGVERVWGYASRDMVDIPLAKDN